MMPGLFSQLAVLSGLPLFTTFHRPIVKENQTLLNVSETTAVE